MLLAKILGMQKNVLVISKVESIFNVNLNVIDDDDGDGGNDNDDGNGNGGDGMVMMITSNDEKNAVENE